MTQAIKKSAISQNTIDQFLHRQEVEKFVRAVSGKLEVVDYQPNSTVRIWYNNQMVAYEPHMHTAFELIMPIEGSYLVTLGQRTLELRPGDIFLIPGGELHGLHAPSRGGRFIMLFDVDFLWHIKGSTYLASCFSTPVLINRSTCPAIYEEEADIIRQVCMNYLEEERLRDITVYTLLMHFFVNYGKFRMAMEGNYPLQQALHTNQRHYAEKFNAVFDYLDRHFAEDLALEDVAAVAGFSKFHFSRTFKQLSGQNFYDYLAHQRIKSSEMLLMQPELSVSNIALQSGFSSVSTFNRTFKKLKGCTPTQYRGMFQVQKDFAAKENNDE